MKIFKNQKGQALLVVVLIMAVALTIGLAVISRSVTDISISQKEEESARVFSVAEAGIEEAIKLGSAPEGGVTIGEITATVEKKNIGAGNEFVFPQKAAIGDSQTIWLLEHDAQGNFIDNPFYTASSLDICWEDTEPETAIEVSIYYERSTDYKVARGAYDAEAPSRGNSFDSPDPGPCAGLAGLDRKKTLIWSAFGIDTATDTLYFLRVRPLYNQTKIGVTAPGGQGGMLPSQGVNYESTATSLSGIKRKVQQYQFYKSPPEILDYVLFSGGNLSKEY